MSSGLILLQQFPQIFIILACIAGGISVRVLYCFGGGAARTVKYNINPSQLRRSLRMAAPPLPGHKNPASYAGYHYLYPVKN